MILAGLVLAVEFTVPCAVMLPVVVKLPVCAHVPEPLLDVTPVIAFPDRTAESQVTFELLASSLVRKLKDVGF